MLFFYLEKIGFSLERIRKLDLSNAPLTVHPLSVFVAASNNYEVLFNIPIPHIRSWGGRRLTAQLNPFIEVINDYEQQGVKEAAYNHSALKKCSDSLKINNAADTLGLRSRSESYFSQLPPHLAAFPWDITDLVEKNKKRVDTLKRELSRYMLVIKQEDNISDNEIRGNAEIARVREIHKSIQKHGYNKNLPDFHHIEGQLLISERNEWVVLIRQGEHRVASLQALGYTEIPILIRKGNIIRRSDSNFWYQVMQKRMTNDEAMDIFDRIFCGDNNAPLVNIVGFFI